MRDLYIDPKHQQQIIVITGTSNPQKIAVDPGTQQIQHLARLKKLLGSRKI